MNNPPSTAHPSPDLWLNFAASIAPPTWRSLASDHLSGKRILITGAGGSIGSALASAAHASHPASLLLLDNSENALYQINRTLSDAGCTNHTPLLASVTDPNALTQAFAHHHPQIVFHAAALKHVPLMEQNPFAAIDTNTLGTLNLLRAATAHHAQQLILVSTDKAVDPISIMGASKRIADRLCNVIGSQGSVLPLFLEQIANNLPLTVTDPDAYRYFKPLDRTIEALLAALHPHPTPAILVPEIDAPIRILDLAHHLLRTHSTSSTIEFTGLRAGDKLTERLLSDRESLHLNPNSILSTIDTPTPTVAFLHTQLNVLREAIRAHNLTALLRATQALVPEYQPSTVITSALTANSVLEIPA
jgi:FlaA1/EpsC-like NDP-sugar epimerase